eukprot:1284119-Prymnesium_polylepis.1
MAYGREHSATAKFVGCSSRVLILSVAVEAHTLLEVIKWGAPAVAISPAMTIVPIDLGMSFGVCAAVIVGEGAASSDDLESSSVDVLEPASA